MISKLGINKSYFKSNRTEKNILSLVSLSRNIEILIVNDNLYKKVPFFSLLLKYSLINILRIQQDVNYLIKKVYITEKYLQTTKI